MYCRSRYYIVLPQALMALFWLLIYKYTVPCMVRWVYYKEWVPVLCWSRFQSYHGCFSKPIGVGNQSFHIGGFPFFHALLEWVLGTQSYHRHLDIPIGVGNQSYHGWISEAAFSDVNMGGITPDGALNGSGSCLFVFG